MRTVFSILLALVIGVLPLAAQTAGGRQAGTGGAAPGVLSGRVLDAGFHSAKPTGDRFPACIVEAVRSMTFPDPGAATYKYALLVEDLPDT